jgi:hypothetical protein
MSRVLFSINSRGGIFTASEDKSSIKMTHGISTSKSKQGMPLPSRMFFNSICRREYSLILFAILAFNFFRFLCRTLLDLDATQLKKSNLISNKLASQLGLTPKQFVQANDYTTLRADHKAHVQDVKADKRGSGLSDKAADLLYGGNKKILGRCVSFRRRFPVLAALFRVL